MVAHDPIGVIGPLIMERTIFLQHYRVCLGSDGEPNELGRDGVVTAYEAVDERTGEAVALTLVPTESVDPALRDQFEDQARAVQRLRHVNIAKVFDFGREGGNYVYISERLPGETLAAWVVQHGPMPADAALRVAEQIVSVLSSVSFHKLPYPPVEPAYILIVPGQTPEGGWPLVKLTNFGLAGVKSDAESSATVEPALSGGAAKLEPEHAASQQATSTGECASAEAGKPDREHRTPELNSEIYSLGGIMYFLLTGAALSPEAVRRPPKFSGFPKPLRSLLAQILHPNPDKRPKDLVVLGEIIRSCLLKIERRLALADRYGIPVKRTIPQPTQPRPRRLLRAALAFGALVIAAAVVTAVLFPESIGTMLRQSRETKKIGVLVGVPESSPKPAAAQNPAAPVAPATILSQAANSTLALGSQLAANSTATPSSPPSLSADNQQTQVSNAQSQSAETPNGVAATSPVPVAPGNSVENQAAPVTPTDAAAAQSAVTAESSATSKKKPADSTSSARHGSVRVRMVGITSDGRLIYRLPSGRTRIVTPDAPRRHRRALIQRDQMFAPPAQFGPQYYPYD